MEACLVFGSSAVLLGRAIGFRLAGQFDSEVLDLEIVKEVKNGASPVEVIVD